MLSLFQSNYNDELDEPISFSDIELIESVTIMIEISCNEIYKFWLDDSLTDITNQLVKMAGVKNKIMDKIMTQIFGINSKTKVAFQTVLPMDFVKKFNDNSLVRIIFFNF